MNIIKIGGYSTSNCEVFDFHSRKFTIIRFLLTLDPHYFEAFSIGTTIVVFSIPFSVGKLKSYVYDTKSDEYSATGSKIYEKLAGVSCVKYYTEN